jgi:predicted transcriptional regulator
VKIPEAKIMVFLENTDKHLHTISNIAARLDKSYDAISKYLNVMLAKGIIRKVVLNGKNYYEISNKDLLKEAKKFLAEVK